MKNLTIIIALLLSLTTFSQDKNRVWDTFEGTRVLFNHSTDMLYRKQFEFIVSHKFGDLGGANSADRFFGLDELADVRIAFEYGLWNRLNIGFGRSKGVGAYRQMIDGYIKYRAFNQGVNKRKFNLTWVSSTGISYAKPSTDSAAANSYTELLERFTYTHQLMISRKFNPKLSGQFSLGINHRNLVEYHDVNSLLFVGVSGRYRFSPILGLLFEYNHILNRGEYGYNQPLSLGLELLTGGHAFAFIFSNSKGVNENVFIPGTYSSWSKGQFRLGFSITRKFKT